MIDAAREAFNQGLHLAAAISAVGSIALAILVVALLRRVRTGAEPEDQPDLEPRWTEHSELERTRVIESPDVTHLRFRVVKQTPSVPLRARPWADVEAFVRVSFASVPIGNTWRGRLVGCPWQTKRTKTKTKRRTR